ncbi:mitochondrial amidoxime reducing component 2-like [Argiope bruennichi]|uniref:mitochondrial amidoxime reducing component 2-like n=1 Tax=Argiope bruennichi TaxID=94029 RepID=UPI002494663B|nr:mitochondrial amidoxime reducing component 2-like [Argiope bruennichi]XP_055954129.1 mitochondrial amidoxime reducing component 2-like [Argiope bruennichi]
MSQNLTTLWIAAAVAVSVMGVLLWKKKKHSFVKVGTISKLYFFPVKSLRGIEIKEGKCTKQGFEVNGLLDRSFMLVNSEGSVITLEKYPSLALLTLQIYDTILTISTPSGKKLNVDIKDSVSPDDKIIRCRVSNDFTQAVDCGDEAASFFQAYLNTPDARLVRHFSVLSKRQYQPKGKGKSFERQLRKENPNLAFQSLAAFHVVSKPSVDDLNSKLQGHKVSEVNFRPNILIDGCNAFEEDSWKYIKFNSGVLLYNFTLFQRCLSTTVDPDTGDMNIKEPLKTLRKYRIPTEPEILEKTGPLPCLGIGCEVLRTGDIAVGDDVLAAVGPQPKMREK